MFPPGLMPQHCAHFEDRDIVRLGHLYPNGKLLQYTKIPNPESLTTYDYFRYLQLRSFAAMDTVRTAATSTLTGFERDTLRSLARKSQISNLYIALTTHHTQVALPYIAAWEDDLGPWA
ncbi:Hypothetical predicted protein [Pelobates cultripes]|uniref:Uncharacterized protein n=1 Tax=Pelobates cultripes TaxID=61616 RepID=A0AAD1RFI1_PELCU|nr:Hypothetical predicted protein [Pelobates cultripes]